MSIPVLTLRPLAAAFFFERDMFIPVLTWRDRPQVWSRMYGFFSTTTAAPWARLGRGAHFFAGALIMLAAAAICRSTHASSLHIDDDGGGGGGTAAPAKVVRSG